MGFEYLLPLGAGILSYRIVSAIQEWNSSRVGAAAVTVTTSTNNILLKSKGCVKYSNLEIKKTLITYELNADATINMSFDALGYTPRKGYTPSWRGLVAFCS